MEATVVATAVATAAMVAAMLHPTVVMAAMVAALVVGAAMAGAAMTMSRTKRWSGLATTPGRPTAAADAAERARRGSLVGSTRAALGVSVIFGVLAGVMTEITHACRPPEKQSYVVPPSPFWVLLVKSDLDPRT